ncbi:prephenate dehydrogenase [Anaeromicropila populeti]|uniref:Prephenate dehydrogenase n=1 Tax=Anaeromicropila populeti TaxID=37658 RepID=A0A1I6KVV0_9FIRM|nr:prephenate dehydrogenase [Anaeromicropila populeti]SFR95369.1 prephenate dehydrogenase [Anaeromicropila populeti]
MEDISVGFIGLGLIGGSIAKSIKKQFSSYTLVGYDHHIDKPNRNLLLALEEGTLNRITTNLETDFSKCDLIFLCGPVLSNIKYLEKLKPHIKPNCILTDVGSVKGNIHEAVKILHLEEHFIGGHPMAGSEKTGYDNASDKLLENAFYVLTPTEKTFPQTTKFMEALVKKIGALPILLDYNTHDDVTAAISHVPHIIAASLVNMVREQDNSQEHMRLLAAGGFKDITRIASSSPVMWQNICLTNRNSIIKFLRAIKADIDSMENAIIAEDEDFLMHSFEAAKEYRDSISQNPKGAMEKIYEVYVDLLDETGAIATIATILASNSINIKNIGILHNREFEEGVLRIELYDQSAEKKSVELLRHYHYTIYER